MRRRKSLVAARALPGYKHASFRLPGLFIFTSVPYYVMARVTVEDCIKIVPSRFELVAIATHRARSIAAGSPLSIQRDEDKDPVIALREIAKGYVDVPKLRDTLIESYRSSVKTDKFGVEQVAEVVSGSGGEVVEESFSDEVADSADVRAQTDADQEEMAGLYADQNIEEED